MSLLTETPHTHFTASAFAPQPAEERGLARDEVRLLVATPDGLSHERFRDLPDHLRAGDVLVVNTSATVPAEVDATLDGEPVVLHVAHHLDGGDRVVELRSAPDAARALLDAAPATRSASATYASSCGSRGPVPRPRRPASATGSGERRCAATSTGSSTGTAGRSPTATSTAATRSRATRRSSAAAPAAPRWRRPVGRSPHELVTRLVTAGVLFAPVTLHTGVSSQEAGEAPGPEWFDVPPTSARIINAARSNGGRVIAVGTTATRAVESSCAARTSSRTAAGPTGSITPAAPPRVVDGSSPDGTTRWRRTCSWSRRSRASA